MASRAGMNPGFESRDHRPPYNRIVSAPGPPVDAGSSFALAVGSLIDGQGGAPVADTIVRIQAGRIEAIGPSAAFGALDVPVIDARHQILMPGLVDVHAHATLPSDRRDLEASLVDRDELLTLTPSSATWSTTSTSRSRIRPRAYSPIASHSVQVSERGPERGAPPRRGP